MLYRCEIAARATVHRQNISGSKSRPLGACCCCCCCFDGGRGDGASGVAAIDIRSNGRIYFLSRPSPLKAIMIIAIQFSLEYYTSAMRLQPFDGDDVDTKHYTSIVKWDIYKAHVLLHIEAHQVSHLITRRELPNRLVDTTNKCLNNLSYINRHRGH